MPDDPVDRLERTVADLQKQVNEIATSGTKITTERIEGVWRAMHRAEGDIAHIVEALEDKADADDIDDLKANYRMVRNIVIAAVATAAMGIAVSIITNAGR